MAVRWSSPSAAQGVNRFKVWDAATDRYVAADMAANWDKLDAIIGGPPGGGDWPASGGLFQEIVTAAGGAIPLGGLWAFFRPNLSVPMPTGAVPCDGRTLTAGNHSFPGLSSVTLPDLRHRFILGADPAKDIGAAAAPATDPASATADGAPGPQATGGANGVALTVDQMPKHTHTGSTTGFSPITLDWYFQQSDYATQQGPGAVGGWQDCSDEALARNNGQCEHGDPERTAPLHNNFEGGSQNWASYFWNGGIQYSVGVGGWSLGQHKHTISALSAEGGGAKHENRPLYVGLIWVAQVT
jgi:hypothetical protein